MIDAQISPPPDLDLALLTRQWLGQDWPPAPAIDPFVEMAADRLRSIQETPELPPAPIQRQRAYRPMPGSLSGRIFDVLRAADRPMTAREISEAIGGRPNGGVNPYLQYALLAGAVVAHTVRGVRRAYEVAR